MGNMTGGPNGRNLTTSFTQAVKKKRIQKVKSQIDPQRDASALMNLEGKYQGEHLTEGNVAHMERVAKMKAQASGMKTLKGGGVTEGVGTAAIEAARGTEAGESALSGGSKGAALAGAGLQMAGMKTDSAAGGGISSGLQAAAMTGNPYIIAGAAVLGAIQGEGKRKAHNKQLEAKSELAQAQAQSTAATQKQKAMGQMAKSFQGYFS